MADEEHKVIAENSMWEFSQALHFDLRNAVPLLRGKNDELIGNLEKIAEATFLMVIVFAAEVTKHKLNSKSLDQFRSEVAVKILVAFSCVEYLRRMRLPEFTEAVRCTVLTVQENATACSLFVESLSPYAEVHLLWREEDMLGGKMRCKQHACYSACGFYRPALA